MQRVSCGLNASAFSVHGIVPFWPTQSIRRVHLADIDALLCDETGTQNSYA
jgi:hypothetical protein